MEINPFSDVCLSLQGELADYADIWFKLRTAYWNLVWREDCGETALCNVWYNC